MPAFWNPIPVIRRIAIREQARVGAAIASSAPQVPHRGPKGPVGGGLSSQARSRKILKQGKSWIAIRWSALGQKLTWFVRGTSRQKARPVRLSPDAGRIRREVAEDALQHFRRLERRERS